jgi:hypothetical protein
MKVRNMTSKSGRNIPNQFEIWDDAGNRYFQSYESIIAKVNKRDEIILDEKYWDYSRTTSKYRNDFLGMSSKEIKNGVEDGTIRLDNLN